MAEKKGWESKCQFHSQLLKIENCLESCVWRRHATYHWKALDEGYNFALNLTSIRHFHKKLWASKMTRIPISGIMGLSIWESWEKHHLDVAFMACHIKYYTRGRWWLSPQVWIVLSLVGWCMAAVCPCTKNAPTMH
jgi:hypothetical protein